MNYEYLIGNKHAKGNKPNKTSFKKGRIPWNKGLKGIHFSPKTEFKLGHTYTIKARLGFITYRIREREHKYRKFIKIAQPNKWEEYAKYVWKRHFDKIIKGDIIHHLNGNVLNDRIDNLIALPREDHPCFHSRWGLKILTKKQIDFYISRYVDMAKKRLAQGVL